MTDQPVDDTPETEELNPSPKPRKRTPAKRVAATDTDRARMIVLNRLKNR